MRVFSAPGKALVAGGYLVLDPKYESYVTALSSRMYARIEREPSLNCHSHITVESPQFDGKWCYRVAHRDGFCVITSTGGEKNPFLEETLKIVFSYALPQNAFQFKITLFSDPGFHTQDDTDKKCSSNHKMTFLYHHAPISHVPKTGMGSSAGLVSVVVTSILASLTNKHISDIIDIVHNVSQIAHCSAQGKIGSGFDIAAAIYGSIIYKRFEPNLIDTLLDQPVSKSYCIAIQNAVNEQWDLINKSCSLPPGLRLLMGDVRGGSETPKLVHQVLEWRKRSEDSDEIYHILNISNSNFIAEIHRLNLFAKESRADYEKALENGTIFLPLSKCISSIRSGLQLLTRSSEAQIEPVEQTKLLDKCKELPGCLGGVVPGAGGYDAICVLVVASQVRNFLEATTIDGKFTNVKWLDLKEESTGVVENNEEDFRGL